MTKLEARILYKQKRALLTGTERSKMEDLMLIQFQRLNIQIPDLVMTFAASEKLVEYDPYLVERFCQFKNPIASFIYPAIENDQLLARKVDENTTFIVNKFGISEPSNGLQVDVDNIELIFVPLLAFDERGYRVGYGKGYYDRFLGTGTNKPLKIGFSYFSPEAHIADVDEHDIALDICITPLKTYHFN